MEETKAPVISSETEAETIKTTNSATRVLEDLKAKLQQGLAALPFAKRNKEPKDPWWRDYNLSQLCYFAACFLLFLEFVGDNPDPNYVIPGLVALVGLTRELLRLFHYVWSFTLGKAAVLVLYATTANIALAFAAMQINLVTGVEPRPFVFTLGFTTVVMLPFWVTLSSMLFFLLAMFVSIGWLLIRLPFRLLGVKLAIHWEDQKLPFVTMVLRFLLIPFVLGTMFHVAVPYLSVTMNDLPQNLKFTSNGFTIIDSRQQADIDLSELDEEQRIEAQQEIDQFEEESQRYAKMIRSVIASFVFNFEAYPNSACMKEPEQRSVYIDENMVLVITRDENADYGYRFEVALCQPRVIEKQVGAEQ